MCRVPLPSGLPFARMKKKPPQGFSLAAAFQNSSISRWVKGLSL